MRWDSARTESRPQQDVRSRPGPSNTRGEAEAFGEPAWWLAVRWTAGTTNTWRPKSRCRLGICLHTFTRHASTIFSRPVSVPQEQPPAPSWPNGGHEVGHRRRPRAAGEHAGRKFQDCARPLTLLTANSRTRRARTGTGRCSATKPCSLARSSSASSSCARMKRPRFESQAGGPKQEATLTRSRLTRDSCKMWKSLLSQGSFLSRSLYSARFTSFPACS